jgi:hypothetical protein
MSSVIRLRLGDDGTVHLPVDNVVAALTPVADHLVDRVGLLPRRRPPAAVPKTLNAVAAGGVNGNYQLSRVDARLLGFSMRETTGAAGATIELRAGDDATADLILAIDLDPGETTREWFGPNGIEFNGGLYVVRVAGTVDGSVWLGEI